MRTVQRLVSDQGQLTLFSEPIHLDFFAFNRLLGYKKSIFRALTAAFSSDCMPL